MKLKKKSTGKITKKSTKEVEVIETDIEEVEEIEETGEIGDCLSRFEKIVQLDLSDDLGIEYFE